MRHVSFQNEGLIDLRAVTIFGVSSKENENPIGYFGTGLKYAIAVFLRLGCKVEMYLGERRFEFAVEKTRIRVDDFDVVVMRHGDESRELAFTTELGKNWVAWQALRELWCNALDEGGEIVGGLVEPREGCTTVVVTGAAAVEAYHGRDSIMLTSKPRWLSQGVEIHFKKSSHIYFRGIRIGDLQRPSQLTYNIVGHPMTLTEDRTMRHPYMADMYVRNAIASSGDEELLREVIEAPRDTFEANIGFSDCDPGPLFLRLLDDVDFAKVANHTLFSMYSKHRGKNKRPAVAVLDANQEEILARAKRLLEVMGYSIDQYPIEITDDLEDHVLGIAHDNTIFINRRTFMQGTKMVAGTLLEEYIHLHHGLRDETRALQNWLVDALVTMGEKFRGDPA